MTANQVQIRRQTRTNLLTIIPASSELHHDTTNDRIHVGNGSEYGGVAQASSRDVQNGTFIYGVAAGTANALTVTLDFPLLSYVAGQKFRVKTTAANLAGGTTINFSGVGVKNILKASGGALVALDGGEFFNGGIAEFIYDGTQMQLVGVSPPSQSSGGLTLIDAQSVTSASSMQFTTGVSASYVDYMLKVSDILVSGTGITLLLQQRISGTWQTTNNTYPMSGVIANSGASTIGIFAPTSQAGAQLMPAQSVVSVVHGQVEIYAKAGQYPVYTYHMTNSRQASSPDYININGSGHFNASSSQVDGFRIIPSSGTITGNARLYGYETSL